MKDYGFVLIIILALLHSIPLEKPYERLPITKDVERNSANNSIHTKLYSVSNKPFYSMPSSDLPSITSPRPLTLSEKYICSSQHYSSDTTKHIIAKDTLRPAAPLQRIVPIATTTENVSTKHEEHEESWLASVSYSGGAEADRTVITKTPCSATSDVEPEGPTHGTKMVEERIHHNMPFVMSLSLQKKLGYRWSIVQDIATPD